MSCSEDHMVSVVATQCYQGGIIDPCGRSRLQNVLFCVVFSALFAFPVFQRSEWSVKLIGRWQGKCNYMLIQQEYKKKPAVLWREKVLRNALMLLI